MNETDPCKCGHSRERHVGDLPICLGCFEEYLSNASIDEFHQERYKNVCNKFIFDNLRFLEQKYDQSILELYKKLETKI
jgi:hypothetical protein